MSLWIPSLHLYVCQQIYEAFHLVSTSLPYWICSFQWHFSQCSVLFALAIAILFVCISICFINVYCFRCFFCAVDVMVTSKANHWKCLCDHIVNQEQDFCFIIFKVEFKQVWNSTEYSALLQRWTTTAITKKEEMFISIHFCDAF